MKRTLIAVLASALLATSVLPAAASGLRVGDEILEIDGLPVAGGKAKELKGALAKSVGQSLRLRLKHSDGETYTAVMTAAAKPPG
jgi:C-terminal processing protease CtpA/Prc